MKKLELLKAINDAQKFSEMIFNLLTVAETPERLAVLLSEEIPEKELQHIKEAALEDNYPLFFSGIQ